jgi:hypothetical protein
MKEQRLVKIIHSKQYIKKYELYLLMIVVGSLTWVFSYFAYKLGLSNILIRYPLSMIFSYAIFLPLFYILLKIWLRRIKTLYEANQTIHDKEFNNMNDLEGADVIPDFDILGIIITVVFFCALFVITYFVNAIPGFVEELIITELSVLFFGKYLLSVNDDFSFFIVFKHTTKIYLIIFMAVLFLSFILHIIFPEQNTIKEMFLSIFRKEI